MSLYQSIITQTQTQTGGRVDISATTSPAPKVRGGYQRTESSKRTAATHVAGKATLFP